MAADDLLARVRQAASELDCAQGAPFATVMQAGRDVAARFGALDTHLSEGGDLPGPWGRAGARPPGRGNLAAAIEAAGLGSGPQAHAMAEAITAQMAAATATPPAAPDGDPESPAPRTYEGHMVFADSTIVSLQCLEGRHSECPDTTPPGEERDDGGPFGGYFCECGACPAHATAQRDASRPVATRFYDALITRYPPDADMPHSPVYVLDVLGLSTLVRRRAETSYVHIDTQELPGPPLMPLEVEVNNGGETTYGETS